MRFLRFLFRNFSIKIAAVFFAAILWFYAVLERNQAMALEMPIRVGKLPAGTVVSAMDTTRALAQLTGKGRDLLVLRIGILNSGSRWAARRGGGQGSSWRRTSPPCRRRFR